MNYIRHLNGFFERLAEDKRMSSYHISLYIALFQHLNANRFSGQFTVSRPEMMELARIGSANTYARCMKELAEWEYIDYAPSSNIHSGSKVTCIRFDTGGDIAGNTAGDTGIKNDTAAGTATDTAGNTGTESDTASDTGTNTAGDSGTSSNLKSDTGADTASDTGIIADTENDTGRSTATSKNESVGIKSDTGTDTASDTLFLNITNRNKLEEKSVKRNSGENFCEKQENQKTAHVENLKTDPDQKSVIPEFSLVELFFRQNNFPGDDALRFYAHYRSNGWKTGTGNPIQSWQAVARRWMNGTYRNNPTQENNEPETNPIQTGRLSVAVHKDYSEPL